MILYFKIYHKLSLAHKGDNQKNHQKLLLECFNVLQFKTMVMRNFMSIPEKTAIDY